MLTENHVNISAERSHQVAIIIPFVKLWQPLNIQLALEDSVIKFTTFMLELRLHTHMQLKAYVYNTPTSHTYKTYSVYGIYTYKPFPIYR